jgi:AraC family transcriptional activator of pobA
MYAVTDVSTIPSYPLEPDEETGNPLFRINHYHGIITYLKDDFLTPHRKNYYFLAFVREGSSRHWVDMKPYVLKPDTVYYTAPHQVHLKEEAKPLTGTSIGFSEAFLNLDESGMLKKLPIIQNQHNGHELRLSPADVVFVQNLLQQISAEYCTAGYMQHQMLLAYVKVLLIYLSRLCLEQTPGTETPDKQLLKSYLLSIDQHYKQLHEVTDYADLLNLSAGHLSELIKEQSGKSAIAHIHGRLIVEAKRLLFHTEQSVKEIAYELGFEDASYFNRFFKRITEYTPINYRNTFREKYR